MRKGSKSIAEARPELVAEWDFERNAPHTPDSVTSMNNSEYWWICPINPEHKYKAIVSNRTRNHNCPFCSGNRVHPTNCLKNLFPDISKEWDYIKNGELKPEDVTGGSGKYVWWRCDKNHSYRKNIVSRTSRGEGCPYCSHNKVCEETSLATMAPELANEWHPSLNQNNPHEVSHQSKTSAWWICSKDESHIWKAIVGNRFRGTGCPFCHASKQQNRLYGIVKEQFPEYDIFFNYKHKDLRFSDTNYPMEFDVYVKNLKLGFEFQGLQHYIEFGREETKSSLENIQRRDKEKVKAAKDNGIYLIEIGPDWDMTEELVLNEIEKFFLNPEW